MYSPEQRIAIVEGYLSSGSYIETQKMFTVKFPGHGIPSKSCIHKLIKKWRQTGSVENLKKNRAAPIRTPAVIDDIQERMNRSPNKSTRKLSQQMNISRRSCQRVLHSLHLKPYRLACVQDLKEEDKTKRVYYCTWLFETIASGLMDPQLYFMSDEAWFNLSGHVNSQNTRYWSVENPHMISQQPLHDEKIGVWCAMSATRIIGPIFFNTNVNSCVYLEFFEEFCSQLTPSERAYAFFQQDGATCHTSKASLSKIYEVFSEERTVSKGLWPPRSPDLSTCDFYLWGSLKGKVYGSNPKTLEELKENIRSAIQMIDSDELQRVFQNMLRRAQKCVEAQGCHFQHLL